MILLILSIVFHVHTSAAFVSMGDEKVYRDLLKVCQRETRCSLVFAHSTDSELSGRGWYGQVRLGHLDASCQPKRQKCLLTTPGRGDEVRSTCWASHGAWGLSAASSWEEISPWWRCYRPWVLDIPIVSAAIAAKRLKVNCPGRKWCPR